MDIKDNTYELYRFCKLFIENITFGDMLNAVSDACDNSDVHRFIKNQKDNNPNHYRFIGKFAFDNMDVPLYSIFSILKLYDVCKEKYELSDEFIYTKERKITDNLREYMKNTRFTLYAFIKSNTIVLLAVYDGTYIEDDKEYLLVAYSNNTDDMDIEDVDTWTKEYTDNMMFGCPQMLMKCACGSFEEGRKLLKQKIGL